MERKSNLGMGRGGYSLVGLLVGIGILGLVLMASGYLLVQTKTVEVRFDLQAEMDRAHLLTLQKTRSTKFLRRVLNISDNPADNMGPANVALKNCFSRQGTGCNTGITGVPLNWAPLDAASSEANCTQGANCKVKSNVTYKANCSSSTTCESLEVRFASEFTGVSQPFKVRENTIKLPGVLLADKANLSFACAQNSNINGINFGSLQAECETARPVNCGAGSQAPLNKIDLTNNQSPSNCPTLVSGNCGTDGLVQVGLVAGQTACRN